MTASKSIARKIAMPVIAAAVLAAGISTSSQPAEAKLSKAGKVILLAGAVVGTAALVGALTGIAARR